MRETSKWGIFLPPPKLGLSKHLETPEAIIAHVNGNESARYIETIMLGISNKDHVGGIRKWWKNDLLDLNRSWRIERSRADHLEEMVESLQREVADLRGKNGWFRRIFPRRAMKKLTGAQMDMLNGL